MYDKLWKYFTTILFFLIVIFISAYLTFISVSKKEEYKVPNVINKDINTASRILHQRKMWIEIIDRKFNDSISKDHIISQDPLPGKLTHKEKVVKVIVSNGSKEVIMPDVVGLPIKIAESILFNMGLLIRIPKKVYSDVYKKDIVIAQNIEPGVYVKSGFSVSLLISNGKKPIRLIVPDFTNMNIEEVRNNMNKTGLIISNIEERTDTKLPGTIIGQYPPPGEVVEKMTGVSFLISKSFEKEVSRNNEAQELDTNNTNINEKK